MTTTGAQTGRSAARRLLLVGAVVAALVGIVHLVLVPNFLAMQPYVGVLFIAGGLGPLVAAIVMLAPQPSTRLRRLAVQLTAVASALMVVLGIISRTTGLPGSDGTGPWNLLFVLSLVLEVAFVALTPRLLGAVTARG